MGVFKSEKFFQASPDLIPGIAGAIEADFKLDGFKVQVVNLVSGGADISLSKGGVFKAIVGMKSALKITMFPQKDGFELKAGVGIFGQQAIPSFLTWFVAWPVLITQIWGMVRQAKLDDRAIAVAERYVKEHAGNSSTPEALPVSGFCTICGKPLPAGAKFCPNCGGMAS